MAETDTLKNYYAHHPNRRPTWRFDLAGEFARKGLDPEPTSDPEWTALITLARQTRSEHPHQVQGPRPGPALRWAGSIYSRGGPLAWYIEGHVLAATSPEQIAARTSLSIEVVRAYEWAYYAVREAMQAGDWITLHVLAPDAVDDKNCERLLWRQAGWRLGPLGVDLLAADALDLGEPAWPDRSKLAEGLRLRLRLAMVPSDDHERAAQLLDAIQIIEPDGYQQLVDRHPKLSDWRQMIEFAAGRYDRDEPAQLSAIRDGLAKADGESQARALHEHLQPFTQEPADA